jgi:hypothetical protein
MREAVPTFRRHPLLNFRAWQDAWESKKGIKRFSADFSPQKVRAGI